MFYTMGKIDEIIRGVAKPYESQIRSAAPLVAVLRLYCYLHEELSPPAPSPVAAHLIDVSFGVWKEPEKYLHSVRRQLHPAMEEFFSHWVIITAEMCRNQHHLLALTVPLLLESQMNAFSDQARRVTLALLSPIIQSTAHRHNEGAGTRLEKPNVEIIVTIHAGRTYYVLVSHPAQVIKQWGALLEAATVLLMPQIVIRAESLLPERDRNFMMEAIRSEIEIWKQQPPALGQMVNWKGRPYFIWMNPTEAELVENELQKIIGVLPIYSASGKNLKPYIDQARKLIERLRKLGHHGGAILAYEQQIEKYMEKH